MEKSNDEMGTYGVNSVDQNQIDSLIPNDSVHRELKQKFKELLSKLNLPQPRNRILKVCGVFLIVIIASILIGTGTTKGTYWSTSI